MGFIPGVSHAPGTPPPFSGQQRVIATVPLTKILTGSQLPPTRVVEDVPVIELPPAFSFGRLSPGVFVEVDQTEPVNPGDVVRFQYRLGMPFLTDWQTDRLVDKLQRDGRYELRYTAYSPEERRLWIEVKVLQKASPAIVIAVAVAAVLIGAAIFTTVESIQKLTTVEVGSFKFNAFPIIAVGVLAVVFLYGSKKLLP